jgi:hypothetical protein
MHNPDGEYKPLLNLQGMGGSSFVAGSLCVRRKLFANCLIQRSRRLIDSLASTGKIFIGGLDGVTTKQKLSAYCAQW